MPKQLKVIILMILISFKSFAFLDAIADAGKDAAKGAAVAGSVAALLQETGVAAKQAKNLIELKAQVDAMNAQIFQIKGLSDETKRLLKGPDYNDLDELSSNIDRTTQYIKTVKVLLTTVGVMSPETSSALSGVTMVNQLDQLIAGQTTQQIERQKEKSDLQRRRINLYKDLVYGLESKSNFGTTNGSTLGGVKGSSTETVSNTQGMVSNFAAKLAIDFYDRSFQLMLLLLPLIFLGKVVFSNFFGSAEDHFDNLKTLVMYLVLMYGFKLILPYMIDLPYLISNYYSKSVVATYDNSSYFAKYVEAEKNSSWSFDFLTVVTAIIRFFEMLVQIVISALFVLLALLAPIIIMLSVMLNLGVGVKLLFGVMFIMSTWNIAIAACEIMVKETLINSPAGVMTFITPFIGASLKILAGATNILLVLKSQAGGATFGKGIGALKNGLMSMGSRSSNSSNFAGANAAFAVADVSGSLDDKLSRMPISNESGTMAGISKAENNLKQGQARDEDLKKARENLGIVDPNEQRKKDQEAREQKQQQREENNKKNQAEREQGFNYARAAKILKEAEKDPKRIEGFTGTSAKDLVDFSNAKSKEAIDTQISKISGGSDSSGIDSRSGSALSHNSGLNSSLESTSNNDSKSQISSDNNSGDSTHSDFGTKAQHSSSHSSNTGGSNESKTQTVIQNSISSAKDITPKTNQIQQNEATKTDFGSTSDDEIQTGHLDKKKGRK